MAAIAIVKKIKCLNHILPIKSHNLFLFTVNLA